MFEFRNSQRAPLSGAEQDKGCGGKAQEDTFAIFKIGPGNWEDEPGKSIYFALVADGVTNKAGGETASRIATNSIRISLEQRLASPFSVNLLEQAIHPAILDANNSILAFAEQTPSLGEMSTTLVLAAIADNQLRIVHVGDSRAYLVRDRSIHRLTLDHTWVQDVLDRQQMTEAEILANPNRNVIQRFLGTRSNLIVDHQIVVPGTYHLLTKRKMVDSICLQPGDVVLLCSDGLTDKLNDQELYQPIASKRLLPGIAAKHLVQYALAKKERDNITSVVLSFPNWRFPKVEAFKQYSLLAAILSSCLILMAIYFKPFNATGTSPLPPITQIPMTATATLVVSAINRETPQPPTETPVTFAPTTEVDQIVVQISATSTETPLPTPTLTLLPAPSATEKSPEQPTTRELAVAKIAAPPTDTPRPWATAIVTQVPPTASATRTATVVATQLTVPGELSNGHPLVSETQKPSESTDPSQCQLSITGIKSGDSVTPRISNVGWNGDCQLGLGEAIEFRGRESNTSKVFMGVSGDVCNMGLRNGASLAVNNVTTNGTIEIGLFLIKCPSGGEPHLVSDLLQVYLRPEQEGKPIEIATPTSLVPTPTPETPKATTCPIGQPECVH